MTERPYVRATEIKMLLIMIDTSSLDLSTATVSHNILGELIAYFTKNNVNPQAIHFDCDRSTILINATHAPIAQAFFDEKYPNEPGQANVFRVSPLHR